MRQLPFFFSLLCLGTVVATGAAQQFTPPPPTAVPKQPPGVAKPPGTTPAQPPGVTKGLSAPCPHPWDGRTIVFVANGAGGGTTMSENLRDAAMEARAGLVVRTAHWSRFGTVHGDNTDQEGHFKSASHIAGCIQELRTQCPHSRFVLVGYSAGTRVVLAAAEMLPAHTLDRIVLCASSVSCGYNLTPALRASCGGIDSFYSAEDTILATAEQGTGTTDGLHGPAMAGRVGFRLPCEMKDCPEYANLRQYRWNPKVGGEGEHTFWVRPLFLRMTLVPLIMTAGCPVTFTTMPGEPPLNEKAR